MRGARVVGGRGVCVAGGVCTLLVVGGATRVVGGGATRVVGGGTTATVVVVVDGGTTTSATVVGGGGATISAIVVGGALVGGGAIATVVGGSTNAAVVGGPNATVLAAVVGGGAVVVSVRPEPDEPRLARRPVHATIASSTTAAIATGTIHGLRPPIESSEGTSSSRGAALGASAFAALALASDVAARTMFSMLGVTATLGSSTSGTSGRVSVFT